MFGTNDDDQQSPIGHILVLVQSDPSNATGVIGGQATFTASFLSSDAGLLTYQWQIQTDGSTWEDLPENPGFYEGIGLTMLTVKAIDNFLATRITCKFRLRATYALTFSAVSAAATLSIPIYAIPTSGSNWYKMPGGLAAAIAGQVGVSIAGPTVAATGF